MTARHVEAEALVTGVDRVLGSLFDHRSIGGNGSARLAIGSTGLFVVVPGTDDSTARTANALAAATRESLVDHLSWIPFIDAVLACDRLHEGCTNLATVVPLDLLDRVLREGSRLIDDTLLGLLLGLLSDGALDPWHLMTSSPTDDGVRIDLCDPPRMQTDPNDGRLPDPTGASVIS